MNYQLYRKPTLTDFLMVIDQLPDDEQEQWEAFSGIPFSRDVMALALANKPGPAWLLTCDGRPLSIAGYDYIRPGVWQDWMVNTRESFEKHPIALTRHVRKVSFAMRNEAHRLQCVSLASRIQAHKWYSCIGLAPEGTLKGYGANGEDAIMFAWVKDGLELGGKRSIPSTAS